MIKKKTIIPAPKKDIASILDTVKYDSKGPSKDYKAKTAIETTAKKVDKAAQPKVLPKIAIKAAPKIVPPKTVEKIVEQKNSDKKPLVTMPKKPVQKAAVPEKKDRMVKNARIESPVVEMPLEHEAYFVYLKNPLEYRRYLLECSRKILFCLRSHQRLLLLRQRKLEEMEKIKTGVKELMYINKKFNEKLPKYNMSFFENAAAKESKDKIKQQVADDTKIMSTRKPEPKREKTELERLEESLANIESKLQNLQ
jgi:hypothetical protein